MNRDAVDHMETTDALTMKLSDLPDSWEKRSAKRYYDKLFKEYCLCDLTFYKQNKVKSLTN